MMENRSEEYSFLREEWIGVLFVAVVILAVIGIGVKLLLGPW
jgi:hypothetical protein